MPISLVNGSQPVFGLYNMTAGSLILTTGQFEFSVAKITGTQQIRLLGSSRLRVI